MTAFHLFNDKQYLYELFDQTGNVATYSSTDYYPFGMPLPGEQLDPNLYRYGYQGQFAEAEPETGNNFFDLRTWDSRLARWTAPDPYQQYFSPYIGMGNNPINSVDPDGGQNIEIASTERNSADVLNRVPSSPSQGGGAYDPEYPMNTSFAGVEDNNYPAPPSASAPEDELLNNSPNRDINSLSNPMSIPEIAPIASDQTDNQPRSWENIDAFFTNPPTPINPTYEERCDANDAEWAAYIESETRYPQPSEPFYMVWANRKWLSEQCSKPRYNWEGMKARQNAEAARVNAEMGRNAASSEGRSDNIYMEGALVLTGVLVADDATGVLIVDDIAIPFILVGGYILDRVLNPIEGTTTSRGNPTDWSFDPEIKRLQNDKYYPPGSKPPWWFWPLFGSVGAYELYQNWPKPNNSQSVQPVDNTYVKPARPIYPYRNK